MSHRLALLLVLACGAAAAQTSVPPAPIPNGAAPERAAASVRTGVATPAQATAPGELLEPAVQKTVIDERGVHIEELRVRGELRSVKVQPKGSAAYEIIPAGGPRDLAPGPGSSRGAAGQRVWPVLAF